LSNDLKLSYTASPHLRSKNNVQQAMYDVIIALLPISAVAVYIFGINAVFTIAVSLVAATLTDLGFRKMLGRWNTPFDGSALVTGLLIALIFSVETSWWTLVVANVIGVGVVKELMGGIGWNRFNPALFGRVSGILFAGLFFNQLNINFAPLSYTPGTIDTVTQATPLALLKMGAEMPPLTQMFIANQGGGLAEVSPLALLVGGAYLFIRGHIRWHIPVAIIATVFLIGLIFEGPGLAVYHVLAGGVMIGALFMATDWVTSPITPKGMLIFGVAIGVLIMVFRLALTPTEGTAFAILIMNAFVPMIDRLTKRPVFGEVPAKSQAGAVSTETAGKPA